MFHISYKSKLNLRENDLEADEELNNICRDFHDRYMNMYFFLKQDFMLIYSHSYAPIVTFFVGILQILLIRK